MGPVSGGIIRHQALTSVCTKLRLAATCRSALDTSGLLLVMQTCSAMTKVPSQTVPNNCGASWSEKVSVACCVCKDETKAVKAMLACATE